MCGIIGISSKKPVLDKILKALKAMEYRGYDSWGIGLKNEQLEICKTTGRVSEITTEFLKETLSEDSTLGIGHTRWATSGVVSKSNAHPHLSAKKRIAIVHNGIVENIQQIKDKLLGLGYPFVSETDTEAVAHLIEYYLDETDCLLEAVKLTFAEIKGRNAFLVINNLNNEIIAIRNGSPLVVGYGENEYYIASDICAFLDYTKNISYVEDNEIIVMNNGVKFYDLAGNIIEKEQVKIEWEKEQIDLGNNDHYMYKEIMEQRFTLANALEQDTYNLDKITKIIKQADKAVIIGSGTAGKVAYFGEYIFSEVAAKEVDFLISSEFKSYVDLYKKGDVLIVVTQSGETADCLQAMALAKEKGMQVVALVNVQGSSIDRQSDYSLYLQVGPEIAVASTKATTAQLLLLSFLASNLVGRTEIFKKNILLTQGWIEGMLDRGLLNTIKKMVSRLTQTQVLQILGTGLMYPIALEGAIKILEVSYVPTLGIAAREMKHYAISLIEPGSPVIVLGGVNKDDQETIRTAVSELKSRGAFIIGIDDKYNPEYDFFIPVAVVDLYKCFPALIILQLIAYYLSLELGYDPDKPRNLAKSVTVV